MCNFCHPAELSTGEEEAALDTMRLVFWIGYMTTMAAIGYYAIRVLVESFHS
ncbi:MAG: hypothetical protein Q7S53_02505 [bacterium]|nr:hypothetical protein [bacterium]